METWEFFLQQVGEENWLRLDPTQPELPTGRYTLAARARHRPYELIEVAVSTRNTPDAIVREQQYQQSCQLDEQGFGILVPDVELTPGVWEIQCRSDILAALLGEDWEITLSLQVTLKSAQDPSGQPQIEQDLQGLQSREDGDQILQEGVTDLFSSFNSTYWEQDNDKTFSAYSLQLDQEQLIADLNKPILISGQVIAHQAPPHPSLRLFITLRDPRTGNLIATLSPRFPDSSFPLPFCYALTVPSRCNSYLFQGEVTLGEDNGQQRSQILARQFFTVTAQWEQLQSLFTVSTPAQDPLTGSPKSCRVLPPRLSPKRPRQQKSPPQLPKLPKSPPANSPEYLWSKPEAETSSVPEWELIPELVITATDQTQS